MSVGERLRALRKHLGLTQEQLAEAAELDRVVIVQIENGRNQASSYAVRKALAKATHTNIERLSEYLDGEINLEHLTRTPAPVSTRERAAALAREDGVDEAAILHVLSEPASVERSALWWAVRMKMREAQLAGYGGVPPESSGERPVQRQVKK